LIPNSFDGFHLIITGWTLLASLILWIHSFSKKMDEYDIGSLHFLDFRRLFQIQYMFILAVMLLYVGAFLMGARQ
jgi:hypothetical protein